jgi:hypothetical protein
MRRFCGCDKGTRCVPATAKMWQRKTAQRAQARLRFFVARAAKGGEAHTGLLNEFFLPHTCNRLAPRTAQGVTFIFFLHFFFCLLFYIIIPINYLIIYKKNLQGHLYRNN